MSVITKTFNYEGGVRIAAIPHGTTVLTMYLWGGAGGGGGSDVGAGGVGSAISYTDTSNTNVPTIGAVATLSTKWGGSLKTVSTSAPSGGSDGDFWFVREA